MSIPSSPTLKDVQAFDPFESEAEGQEIRGWTQFHPLEGRMLEIHRDTDCSLPAFCGGVRRTQSILSYCF